VETAIQKTEAAIEAAETRAADASSDKAIEYWRVKENALREREKQLRKEKEQLREELLLRERERIQAVPSASGNVTTPGVY